MNESILGNYCTGGCSVKLGPGFLADTLSKLPKFEKNEDLLIGYDTSDDAAVYKISDDVAIIQTLDFFPPMVEEPYLFGKIAAANALSDVYAMGGEVKTALNIVAYPEKLPVEVLGEILRGGSEKVNEAGGVLAGGHSINDTGIKYGLSVMGVIDPKNVLANCTPRIGDVIVMTKPIGVGIITTAYKLGECSKEAYDVCTKNMETLNMYAAKVMRNYNVSACTDVTGFGFLGHLSEMIGKKFGAEIHSSKVNILPGALKCASEFVTTAGGQRNRNYISDQVTFSDGIALDMEEVLFDPQTSGGLIITVDGNDVLAMVDEMKRCGVEAVAVGKITDGDMIKVI